MRDEMALGSAPLSAAADHRYRCGYAPALGLSFAKPTVTFRATDKVLRNLLRRFPFRDLNSIPISRFVIDEHMRTGTLNWRLYLESYPVAVGRGANLIDILPSCRSQVLIPPRSLREREAVR